MPQARDSDSMSMRSERTSKGTICWHPDGIEGGIENGTLQRGRSLVFD
jgi:hypothetical protein